MTTAQEDDFDVLGVPYVFQRIGVEQYEICALALLDRANAIADFHDFCRCARCGLARFARCAAKLFHMQGQFVVPFGLPPVQVVLVPAAVYWVATRRFG